MLTLNVAKKIGINTCIDKLGHDFVLAHRDTSSSAYGEIEDEVFCFVGVDDRPVSLEPSDVLTLSNDSAFPYRASCNVSLFDGTVTFTECVLPS